MGDQQFQLRVHKGPELEKIYQLNSVSLTIGRDPMADITISDPEVSRQHARLIGTISGYRIQDLGSTNGTFIEGVRLSGEPTELQPEQVISLGSSVDLLFQVQVDQEDQLATLVDGAFLTPEPQQQESEIIEAVPASDPALEELPKPILYEPDDEEVELVDNNLVDEGDPDQPVFAEAPPDFAEWDQPLHEEPATVLEPNVTPEFSQSKTEAEPFVIPHQGDPPQPSPRRSSRRPITIIVTLLLLVLCCCCSFILFVYYYGGDWLLREMGLLP